MSDSEIQFQRVTAYIYKLHSPSSITNKSKIFGLHLAYALTWFRPQAGERSIVTYWASSNPQIKCCTLVGHKSLISVHDEIKSICNPWPEIVTTMMVVANNLEYADPGLSASLKWTRGPHGHL